MFYSKSTGGFYDATIHGDAIPDDAVEITDAAYQALLIGQSAGKIIATDAKGGPINVDPPALTDAQLWSAYQVQAQAALNANDAVAIRCIKAGVQYPAAWQANDVALRAIMRAPSGDSTQPIPARPATYPAGT